MKKLPSSEVEWIVVYAFYASDFGEKTFSRQDLITKYEESGRLDTGKKNTLSINISRAVTANLINPLAVDFSILDNGINKAKEIINRSTSSVSKTAKSGTKKASANSSQGTSDNSPKKKSVASTINKRLSEIDFHPTGKDSLKDFYKKYTVKNDNERNLLFVHYLLDTLKIDKITLDHIYTCYDELNLRIPENMSHSIGNTKKRTGWIDGKPNVSILITTKGKNKLKFWDDKKQ